MSARIAKSLGVLRDQVNKTWPDRDTDSDGWIAGSAHHQANPTSDHEADRNGVVHALDITHDPRHGCDSYKLAEALLDSQDERIKYVISNRKIASGEGQNHPAWKWRVYNGSNDHSEHVHISVKGAPALADSTAPWMIGTVALDPPPLDPPPLVEPDWHTGITATVFGGDGETERSAYDNHRITNSELAVALPYRLKGGRPKVMLRANGKTAIATIEDVGPWNINDPYWERGARPQAETGRDKRGRRTNKAGIDLSPALARKLGIEGKGKVDWKFV